MKKSTWERGKKVLAWIRDGECIRCTSHRIDSTGYPRMVRHGKLKSIARWILTRRHGDIPTGMLARHTCDNRWCIRPDHIIIGTKADNMNDRKERGSLGKLTRDQVLQIREAIGSQREIAASFGISQGNVHLIKRRKRWGHIA